MNHAGVGAALCLMLLGAGCGPSREAQVRSLHADDPREQVAEVARIVRSGDKSLAGELIALLEAEDEAVRFVAAAGLRRLTGQDFRFHFASTDEERAAVVRRYRQWWETEGRAACGAPSGDGARPDRSGAAGEAWSPASGAPGERGP